MLKDLVNRVKSEIDEERKERENSQETLISLLEDACNKLCSTAQQWVIKKTWPSIFLYIFKIYSFR